MHWAGEAQAYITPVAGREVSVAIITSRRDLRFDQLLFLFPELSERLKECPQTGREHSGTSWTLRIPCVVAPRVAAGGSTFLLGEASGCVDAITGEGLTLLLRQAVALRSTFEQNQPSLYQHEHRRIMRRARLMGSLLFFLDEHPGLRHFLFKRFAAEPLLFEALLKLHLGVWPRLRGKGGCLDLTLHLLQ